MGNSVVPHMVAVTAHATAHASVGSNIGPAFPVLVGLALVGLAGYLIRRRGRRG